MALVTAPTPTIPDTQYEFHTITVDSVGQASANTFTAFLNVPLRNVVQAALLGAHIHTTNTTEHVYISISELDSIFTDRASKDPPQSVSSQPGLSVLRNSFASLITESNAHTGANDLVVFRANYPIIAQYIDPINTIDRLTVTIRDQNGDTIEDGATGDNFLILHFVCRKPNLRSF
ncbi:hypothetical protein [Dishui Lake phycodnavirus 3]|nr:hypothetical protein [Dishui Lake phycodnavirus 3]